MEDYGDIVDIFEKVLPADPPDDFTRSVMGKISRREKNFTSVLIGGIISEIIVGKVNRGTCVLQFVMVGVFYLILSVILRLGFDRLPETVSLSDELNVQFYFAFLFAVTFILLGIAFLKSGAAIVRIAESIIMLYVAVLLANVIVFPVSVPLPRLIFMIFIIMGVMVGLFLELTVRRYREILEYGTD